MIRSCHIFDHLQGKVNSNNDIFFSQGYLIEKNCTINISIIYREKYNLIRKSKQLVIKLYPHVQKIVLLIVRFYYGYLTFLKFILYISCLLNVIH